MPHERPTLLDGARFDDARGTLTCCNDCDLAELRRFYVLTHPDTATVRGWNAHRFEAKRFFCLRGGFEIALLPMRDFARPEAAGEPTTFRLEATHPRLLCAPAGYANAIKATEPGSILLVFSDKTLDGARDDNWKYPPETWPVTWSSSQ